MLARSLDCDLRTRVAGTNQEHAAGLQLPETAVLARVHLQYVRAQILGESRHARNLVTRHRNDHMVGFEPVCACVKQISVSGAREVIDAGAVSNGQLKSACVVFEIIRHLIFRWKRKRRTGKLHPDEAVERRRRKQSKRVPPLAPGIAYAFTGVEDHERTALASQVIADRQSRLAAADYDRV